MIDNTLSLTHGLLTGEAYRTTRVQMSREGESVHYSERALSKRLRQIEAEFDVAMARLSPESASLELLDLENPKIKFLASKGALARLPWVVATRATGNVRAQPSEALEVYLRLGEWWAINILLDYRPTDENTLDEQVLSHEFLDRTSAQTVRYAWATREVALALAAAVCESSKAAELLPELTVRGVEDLLDALLIMIPGGRLTLSEDAHALAEAVAIAAGGNRSRSLNVLMTTKEIQNTPWVRFSETELLPVAPGVACLWLDRSLFALVDRRLRPLKNSKLTKGEFFEVVSERCLAVALGISPTSTQRGMRVRVSSANEGELDISLGEPVAVIGECKAKVVASMNATGRAFEQEVVEAVEQVRMRLASAVKDRARLTDLNGRCYQADPDVCGVVVVMHAYGGSLTSPEMLNLLPSEPVTKFPVVVADLHSWLLIAHALGSVSSLRDYLTFRGDMISRRITALEEFDLLVLYLSPNRNAIFRRMMLLGRDPNNFVMLSGTKVKLHNALQRAKPKSARLWCRALYADALTVH